MKLQSGTEVVDGQTLKLPSEDEWEQIDRTGLVDGLKVPTAGRLSGIVKFVSERQNLFLLAVMPVMYVRGRPPLAAPLTLMRREDGLCRVNILYVPCKSCGGLSSAAQVADLSIFEGADDPEAAMEKARAIPRVDCPRCGGEMDRAVHAIWAEPMQKLQ